MYNKKSSEQKCDRRGRGEQEPISFPALSGHSRENGEQRPTIFSLPAQIVQQQGNVNQVVSLVEAGTRLEKVCVYEHSSESSLLGMLCISLHGPFRKPWMISYDYHALVVRSQVEYKKKGANGQNMHLNPSINAGLLLPYSQMRSSDFSMNKSLLVFASNFLDYFYPDC